MVADHARTGAARPRGIRIPGVKAAVRTYRENMLRIQNGRAFVRKPQLQTGRTDDRIRR